MRHSYPDVAREVCIRWFNRWLKGEEDETTPIKEPDFTIENYDTISCYPRTNHSQVMTIPEFFNKKTEELTQKKTDISIEGIKKVFLTPPKTSLKLEHLTSTKPFTPEIASLLTFFKGDDGTFLTSFSHWPDCNLTSDKALIVVGNNKYDFYSSEKTPETYPIIQQALQNNISVWVVDLPGFGEGQLPGHTINTITSSRACHMIGFTLAGYWISLLQSLAQTIKQSIKTVYLYAIGGPSTAILAGSPLLTEFDKITVVNPVGSYKISNNFMNIPFETLIPNLLTVGDIPDFAGMRAPKPLTVVAPTSNDGSHLSTEEIFKLFSPTIQRYLSMDKGEAFNLLGKEEFKSTFPFYFNP